MKFGNLCKPAQLYGVISFISIALIFLQNISMLGSNHYCVGTMECELQASNWIMFVFKIGYVLLNVIILDSLCKNNYSSISWAFVLAPYIMFFIVIALIMLASA
jgi:hypothetical protein